MSLDGSDNVVVLIAYHFPPLEGSSGVQRALRFAQYLPEFGWRPIVLTVNTRAYGLVGEGGMADTPSEIEVIRAPAWDASRHFAISGRYPGFLARPDRWASWWLGAMFASLPKLRRAKPRVLWSTYPVATAHMIGASLSRVLNLPWVADFRDPMLQTDYPEAPSLRRSFRKIERLTLDRASCCTFTTPSAVGTYQERYPQYREKILKLENGFDEAAFEGLNSKGPLNRGKLTLLHSGIVYPSERDPTHLFKGLASLKITQPAVYSRLVVRFRAPVHDRLLNKLAHHNGVADAIQIVPPIPYREALTEMLSADALLVLQASNCNEQIPAKLYEYLRAMRPMLVLSDLKGDTADAASSAGITTIAPLDDADAIARLMRAFVENDSEFSKPNFGAIRDLSRQAKTRELASLLDAII